MDDESAGWRYETPRPDDAPPAAYKHPNTSTVADPSTQPPATRHCNPDRRSQPQPLKLRLHAPTPPRNPRRRRQEQRHPIRLPQPTATTPQLVMPRSRNSRNPRRLKPTANEVLDVLPHDGPQAGQILGQVPVPEYLRDCVWFGGVGPCPLPGRRIGVAASRYSTLWVRE